MRIRELYLYTQDLHAQRIFYTRTLGLPLVTETDVSFTIQSGATRLLFQRSEKDGLLYHFAFSIPSNKLVRAKEWLKARTPPVPLLSLDGQDWFRRKGKIVGYGFVRFGAEAYTNTHACKIGPIGADTPENATAIVLAAIHWAAQRSTEIHIDVPGPHSCLAVLLERGFHIKSFDTFVCSGSSLFLDARCYIAGGGDMF